MNCETQLLTDQKLSSPIFTCCLVGCPDRWHLHLSLLFDVLDHTNHTFSESLWHPLSTDPLTTHPSATQTHPTHQTHKEPTLPDHFSTLWRSTPYKQNIFRNQVFTDSLTTHPSPTQTHQAHHMAFWVSHSLLCLVWVILCYLLAILLKTTKLCSIKHQLAHSLW